MQTPASRPARAGALLAAFADWARTDGQTWIYLFKAVGAGLLALGVSMKLDLPLPRTAMTTVFIVMQPQSGAVFAKSFYRVCGTLVGLVVMLALISLFSQQPELFIVSTALWVGLCTAGAARNRNFRSYGFVLAGYTAALIGLPVAQHPNDAFMTALTRVAEIVVGILCSGLVSAVVFPQYAGEQLRTTVRRRFSSFVDYVSATLAGQVDRSQVEATQTRFIADIVGFEATRSIAVFDSPDARMRGGRLARMNSEFMMASTRFHALHQLMNRLRSAGSGATIDALEPYFREIAPLLRTPHGEPVATAADAIHVSRQIEAWRDALPERVRATRAGLERHPEAHLPDFDTATELLYRFLDDLHEYTATYASLAVDAHARERWIERYEPKTNLFAAGLSGVRAAVVMTVLGAYWIATAWPSGATLVLNAAALCALASSSPNPTRTSVQMALGTALSSFVGLVITFGIFPHIDGFPLLCAVLAPALALGVYLSTRPRHAGYGVGYCIFFCFLAGPDNVIRYDPIAYMNDALALVLSMAVCAAAFAVFVPTSARWIMARLLDDLRGQAVLACRSRLRRLRNRFESGARDLTFQINTIAGVESGLRRDALRWLFSVLEVGNAVIDLRAELAALPDHPRYGKTMPWRQAIGATFEAVSALFSRPQARRHARAIAATDAAIAAGEEALHRLDPPPGERRQLQRILSHLHFIRTALIDPQSPLEPFAATQAAPQGDHHAP
ncbi:FUSC family protein [Burkholderia sp. WAC0059]|uniref:FUSC family protein n=1 Tax=Burkholderia sp. WAC0059 TaxID=2066022 RepID=UPI000C7EC9D0|nr:FUSC family protein [Burkholderia sp. WAC0059]PLZ00351.1 FUSC family protein [Burkholderia sp. WAC0059]